MLSAGGVGAELAAWICDGAPDRDMFSYDPRRFHADCAGDASWAKRSTHESYAKTSVRRSLCSS